MAQSASERKAAQRRLAKEIKAGTYKPLGFGRKPHAAKVLGYSTQAWDSFDSSEKEELRNEVRNAERRVERFANRPKNKRTGRSNHPQDWETWEWDLYKEAVGK